MFTYVTIKTILCLFCLVRNHECVRASRYECFKKQIGKIIVIKGNVDYSLRSHLCSSWFLLFICCRQNWKSGDVKIICNFSILIAPTTSVPWTTWLPWTSPSAQASCNFDYGLCYGWSQSSSDIFDWTRRRGNTSSLNTGPSSDHTTGNGKYNFTVNNSTVSESYQSTRPFSLPLSIICFFHGTKSANECLNGVNRKPSNGLKLNRQP